MQKRIVITINDYQRLMGLMEFASLKSKIPGVTDRLVNNLEAAKLLPQKQIASNVITMNSRIKLKDLERGRNTELTITYPHDADPRESRVSIFSEIGLALLGSTENDVVSWQIPGGVGKFLVEKVTYQPEAAGDYYL